MTQSIRKTCQGYFILFIYSGTQWHYFVTADLLVELTKCLLSSKVTSAVIIWRRHQVISGFLLSSCILYLTVSFSPSLLIR